MKLKDLELGKEYYVDSSRDWDNPTWWSGDPEYVSGRKYRLEDTRDLEFSRVSSFRKEPIPDFLTMGGDTLSKSTLGPASGFRHTRQTHVLMSFPVREGSGWSTHNGRRYDLVSLAHIRGEWEPVATKIRGANRKAHADKVESDRARVEADNRLKGIHSRLEDVGVRAWIRGGVLTIDADSAEKILAMVGECNR
jgi:hypothetical protein